MLLAMLKLLLLVAAMPLVLVGSVRLGVWLIRYARAHRGEVIASLLAEDFRGRFGAVLDTWVDEPVSGTWASSQSDHHVPSGEHHASGDHSHGH